MNRFLKAIGLGALLAFSPLVLTACNGGSISAAAVDLTTASPAQVHTVAAAENLYTIVARATLNYVKVNPPSVEIAQKLKDYDNQAFNALKAARAAAQSGNSPAVAVALEQWNARYGDLARYLGSLGVAIPKQ